MSIWKKKKAKPQEVVLSKEEETELLKQIISDFKKELMNAKVQEYIYMREVIDPVHIGKQKAEEGVAMYQKRAQYLKENIQAVQMYCEEHDIKI